MPELRALLAPSNDNGDQPFDKLWASLLTPPGKSMPIAASKGRTPRKRPLGRGVRLVPFGLLTLSLSRCIIR